MPLTAATVQQGLEADEPDYTALARRWGSEALPHLELLARLPNPAIAPRAIYLAGKIADPKAARIVLEAARNPDPRWKTAAAAAAAGLADADASAILSILIADRDPGVRKIAVGSTPLRPSAALLQLLAHAASVDPVPYIRQLAHDALLGKRPP